MQKLNDIMEFDHVIAVHDDGSMLSHKDMFQIKADSYNEAITKAEAILAEREAK